MRTIHCVLLLGLCGCGEPSGSSAPPTADMATSDAGLPMMDAAAEAPDLDPPPDAAQDAAPLSEGASWSPPDERGRCEGAYARPEAAGELSPGLEEISGLAVSGLASGILWAHNDSGDGPALYPVDETGATLGEVRLTTPGGAPVDAVDFEDIAAAPCPDGSGPCLWVADVGDNPANRDGDARRRPRVYVVPEPAPEATEAEARWRWALIYPDGPMDAEALVVAPDGQALALFEKVDGAEAEVLMSRGDPLGALAADASLSLELMGRAQSPGVDVPLGRMITGADLHPSGSRLVVRVYTGTFEAELPEGLDSLAEPGSLVFERVALGPLAERQGEAVTYDGLGTGLWTASEAEDGPQPLHHYRCED